MEHLAQVVCEIERRTTVDAVVILPIVRSDLMFDANAVANVAQANRGQPIKCQFAKRSGFFLPIDVWVLMRDWDQDVDRTVTAGSQ